ncbi:hypothetical protein [Candidatus Kuenenia stuttgartiensis]|uniref:hypothetical protein n=1 Tax=Kuenenia stuttgartiensis TaxID=174633 RepID=UPI00146CB210|nr:hypothetical protein [Candidatus Kuenenia stuttgartiensis]
MENTPNPRSLKPQAPMHKPKRVFPYPAICHRIREKMLSEIIVFVPVVWIPRRNERRVSASVVPDSFLLPVVPVKGGLYKEFYVLAL